jgi:hypothetical protein
VNKLQDYIRQRFRIPDQQGHGRIEISAFDDFIRGMYACIDLPLPNENQIWVHRSEIGLTQGDQWFTKNGVIQIADRVLGEKHKYIKTLNLDMKRIHNDIDNIKNHSPHKRSDIFHEGPRKGSGMSSNFSSGSGHMDNGYRSGHGPPVHGADMHGGGDVGGRGFMDNSYSMAQKGFGGGNHGHDMDRSNYGSNHM